MRLKNGLPSLLCALVLTIGAAGLSAAWARLPEVTVVSELSVIGPKVYIDDLFTEDSLKALRMDNRLESTVITLSPGPGKSKTIDGNDLRDRLREIGITPDRYSIQIPDRIRVGRLAQTLLPQDIETLLKRDFLPALPWEEVELLELGAPESVVLPSGTLDVSFQQPSRTNLARPFYLNVDFRVDGQLVKRAYLKTVLTIIDTAPVAIRELAASSQIRPEDVRWEKRPLRSTLRPPVPNMSFFEGQKLRVNVAAGSPLTQDMFVSVPLIQRGDSVMVVYEDGPIRLSVMGQSLTSGSKGDRIRVLNKDSRVELIGEIIDAKTVRVTN